MNNELRKNGFSLPEVMMASAILAVGLLMIAGTFPVAIFLMGASVEQTIAPIAADEAFVKIQLYGIDVNSLTITDACAEFKNANNLTVSGGRFDPNEYLYPSAGSVPAYDRMYNWSAICRRIDLNQRLVQVTVFVSRKTGAGLLYPDPSGIPTYDRPTPLAVNVLPGTGTNVTITGITGTGNYITDGCTIVADASGNIYRVLDHSGAVVTLDRAWVETRNFGWVVPPPTSGGRSPCVGVYQRIMKF